LYASVLERWHRGSFYFVSRKGKRCSATQFITVLTGVDTAILGAIIRAIRGKVKMNRIGIISMFLVVIILISTSCASGVSQEEHERVINELSAIQGELASLQSKLTESVALQAQNEELNNRNATLKSEFDAMQTKHEELSAEYDELNIKYDTMQSEYETLHAQYKDLSAEYEELSKQYEAAVEGEAVEIGEEDVEQALFELINEGRINNGLEVLPWRETLHTLAKKNSIDMATNKDLRYPENGVEWREVYWAAGYNSAGEIAEATHLVWENRDKYERYFLDVHLNFGAVGVYKSGDIFYITYIGDQIR